MTEAWNVYLDNTIPASPGKLTLIKAFGDLLKTQLEILPYELPEIFAPSSDEEQSDPTPQLIAMKASSLSSSFANGTIRTYVRPIGGGELSDLAPQRWGLDDPLPRFSTGLLSLEKWYDNSASPTHRIFISLDDFAHWMTKLSLKSTLTDKELLLHENPLMHYQRLAETNKAEQSESKPTDQVSKIEAIQPTRITSEIFLTREEVERVIGMRRSFIYDQMQQRRFPLGIKMGNRTRWLQSEIFEWMKARADDRG